MIDNPSALWCTPPFPIIYFWYRTWATGLVWILGWASVYFRPLTMISLNTYYYTKAMNSILLSWDLSWHDWLMRQLKRSRYQNQKPLFKIPKNTALAAFAWRDSSDTSYACTLLSASPNFKSLLLIPRVLMDICDIDKYQRYWYVRGNLGWFVMYLNNTTRVP